MLIWLNSSSYITICGFMSRSRSLASRRKDRGIPRN
jgi:hypothetical protein